VNVQGSAVIIDLGITNKLSRVSEFINAEFANDEN
jgi:hypothetical protein